MSQSAPDKFVKANGTQLTLYDEPYKFIGINIYNANSINNCWYMGTGTLLELPVDIISFHHLGG